MNTKIKWLREKLRGLDMQGMIVSNPINIKYLTGIDAEGVLLVTRKENHYITDSRYLEEVHSTVTIDDEIIISDFKDISDYDYENFFSFCENVGFEEDYITYGMYKKYMQKYKVNNLEETEYLIEKARMIKDEEEIARLQKACEITDRCFDYLLKMQKKIEEKGFIEGTIHRYLIVARKWINNLCTFKELESLPFDINSIIK